MAKRHLHAHVPEPDDSSLIWRVERELGEIDLLGWLEAQPHTFKMYWQSRDGALELAGVGAADRIAATDVVGLKAAIEHIRAHTAGSPARYLGGLCFDSTRQPRDPSWAEFGDFLFVLPLVEVARCGEKVTLSMNALRSRIEEDGAETALSELKLLRESDQLGVYVRPHVGQRQDHPDQPGWLETVQESLACISRGELHKVVPARRSDFPTTAPLSPWRLLKKLRDTGTGRCLFGFQTSPGTAFVGASPERLYRRDGVTLESEALAGTRPTSDDPDRNRQLADELLASDKERREHGYVVDHLKSALESLCERITVDPQPKVVQLPGVQHLRTGLRGELQSDVDDTTILRTLHPTPAVGGLPRAAALEHLRKIEPFDRGWYAGPVGVLDASGVEFAVAIRSALIRPDRLSLFAGAGVVEGSDPDREWVELESKIAPFVEILS